MNFNFMRQLPKDRLQKVVLVCIVTLCTVVGVVEGYVLKNWSALSIARNRIANLKDQVQQADRKAQQAVQDVAYNEQVKSFVEMQHTAMIAGDPFAWVVREISLLAEQHPIHVLGMQPGVKAQQEFKSSYGVYTARIEIDASYDELGVFLQDFENKYPTAEIRSLSVAVGDATLPQRRASLELAFPVRSDTESHKPTSKLKAEKKTL